jgi:phosphoenolpyruvate carboxykinase (diphosphate)
MNTTHSRTRLGFDEGFSVTPDSGKILPVIRLKMMATGLDLPANGHGPDFMAHTADLIRKIQEKFRGYPQPLCPLDARLQAFLDGFFADTERPGRLDLPLSTLHMDFHGLARTLSIPAEGDRFESEYLKSYKTDQGVLHNPATDKRTTKGTFHVCEGGLPIAADKKAVPKAAFAGLLWNALNPPAQLMELPFTTGLKTNGSKRPGPARVFTSLFIRPLVSPEVPGLRTYRDMEIRFFAPGSLVSNLDFVESIFGNAGDPYLPENDAGLDPEHFTGVTGCVILAPHLPKLKKKDLGLPHVSAATPAQKKDGMCWSDPGELYNEGKAFKATIASAEGVIITLIADNYFGYCKKEVKTQIGFASNLTGFSEEEHAGGALIFPSYSLGDFTQHNAAYIRQKGYSFKQVKKLMGEYMRSHIDGYGIDARQPKVVYLPEDAEVFLLDQKIAWTKDGKAKTLRLLPEHVYIYPSGYKVRMEKHPDAPTWRLIGTVAEGLLCHKPCTVSGGGKSEISKSIAESILYRNVYIQDFDKDFDAAERILDKDFAKRFKAPASKGKGKDKAKLAREILSPTRSLGSVVRLLTPSPEYTGEHNRWLGKIPPHVRSLVFTIKRFYRPEWGEDIRSHFSVDVVDGRPGHELSYHHRPLVSSYLRVGTEEEGNWRVFRLRTDFVPAFKLQVEDDITASTVLPAEGAGDSRLSRKFVQNCEYRLFQRPDDAIHPGLDPQAEGDLAQANNFMSNYEPLPVEEARRMQEDAIAMGKYTSPMRKAIGNAAAKESGWFVCTSRPRMTDGKPNANVRYLQNRPDLVNPFSVFVANAGIRLKRKLSADAPLANPVDAVLIGRRNNPIDREAGIKPLAVYNPLHFQELPEAFMDFVASPTGKSPSTTGAGSEGALTKGPFNALWPTADLNAALVSFILTGLKVFSTPAGHIGTKYRVDHDMSLLIPELWCRMTPEERDADKLIEGGHLSLVSDYKAKGKVIPAGRLGYRINARFVHNFLGRIFSDPLAVFPPDMLEPELQGQQDFNDGIENIAEAQRAAAQFYFEDGSVDSACPPLRALLHIMAKGSYEGLTLKSPELRKMFSPGEMLKSSWYKARLARQQEKDKVLWARHRDYLKGFIGADGNRPASNRLGLARRLAVAEKNLLSASRSAYLDSLMGTLGIDPIL